MHEGRRHVFDRYVRKALGKTAVQLSRTKPASEAPPLNLLSIISSLRSLAVRGSRFAEFSAVPGDFLSWRHPSLTLSGLMVYTIFCMRPQIVLVVPFIVILGSTFIPQYANRYIYPDRQHAFTPELVGIEVSQDQGEKDLVNMLRSIQASLSNIVGLLEWVDHIRATFGDFSDPHESSALFIFCLVLLGVSIAISKYVNLKLVFILFGWSTVCLMHPGVRSLLEELASEVEEIEEKIREWKLFTLFYAGLKRQFVFADEEVYRVVEVFEIEKQGLTSRFWEPVGFISELNPKRGGLGHKFHHPARDIDAVEPPPNWLFAAQESWTLDNNTNAWAEQRGIDLPVRNGWLHSYKGNHRARRHTRQCYYKPQGPQGPQTPQKSLDTGT